MKKHHLQVFYSALLGSTICAVAIAGISMRGVNGSHPPNAPALNDALIGQGNAEGRLRKGAKEKGHYVATWDDPQWKQARDIKTLAKSSSFIILGRAAWNVCKLSQDGDQITIDYGVKVSDVIKGNVKPGINLAVSLPGGMVRFADGTSAEFRTPTFRKMNKGRTYLLFLSMDNKRGGILVPTHGPQSIFEVSLDGASASHFSADFTAPQPPPQNLNAVLSEIRDAVKK
jgi:hypothetical protein